MHVRRSALLFCCVSVALPLSAQRVMAPAAARFLSQASWGPTPAAVQHVQDIGFEAWLNEQFAAPKSPITDAPVDPATKRAPYGPVQAQFFVNANHGADQLRQRVMFALGQIWVVSGVKLNDAQMITPYLRLLQDDSFATYDKIMYDVTLSPAMGHYLDMVNNDKPNPVTGKGADENYAREILQLFTIGLSELNPDGTLKMDANGQPIPTFDQETIEGFARTFTGWTYAPAPGATARWTDPANWTAPMVAVEAHHDTGGKVLLDGKTLAAGHSAETDLQQALAIVFAHPNVAPFVSRQLIQHLVTGSPSSGYVERVATVFSESKGDMKKVIAAILLDEEARAGDNGNAGAGEGHLREPVLFINGLLRGLGATVDATNSLVNSATALAQQLYYPPTVFNYFAPGYDIGGTKINAPEFQLLSESNAVTRVNFVNTLVYGKLGGVAIDYTRFANGAATVTSTSAETVLDTVAGSLLGAPLPQDLHDAILPAVQKQTTTKAMAQTAVYLIASSWQYQVER